MAAHEDMFDRMDTVFVKGSLRQGRVLTTFQDTDGKWYCIVRSSPTEWFIMPEATLAIVQEVARYLDIALHDTG